MTSLEAKRGESRTVLTESSQVSADLLPPSIPAMPSVPRDDIYRGAPAVLAFPGS
jgi:hypothetical protein